MKRVIAVIATAAIERELANYVVSLRRVGWQDPVHVWYPEGDAPELPPGCVGKQAVSWWESDEYPDLSGATNYAALIKPQIFKAQDQYDEECLVLYTDCADLVFLKHPDVLFDMCEGYVLCAHRFYTIDFAPQVPQHAVDNMGCDKTLMPNDSGVNNGVILGRVGAHLTRYMQRWEDLIKYYLTCEWFAKRLHKHKLGDQITFNVMYREMERDGRNDSVPYAGHIPVSWNYRGGPNVKRLRVKNGALLDPKGREVYVPHATGSGNLPDRIVKLATGV